MPDSARRDSDGPARTTIAHALPGDGQVALALFDVGGRRVRLLVSGWRRAGLHRETWDGSDDAGRRVGPGTYYIRLRAPSGTVRGTVTLLR